MRASPSTASLHKIMFPLNAYPGIPKILVGTEQRVLSSHIVGTFTCLHSPFSVHSCFVHSAVLKITYPHTASAQHPAPQKPSFSILRRTCMFLFLPLSPLCLTIRLKMHSPDTQNPQTIGTSHSSRTLHKQQSSPRAPRCLTHLLALDFHSHLKQADLEP